jgi:hypothetical protein
MSAALTALVQIISSGRAPSTCSRAMVSIASRTGAPDSTMMAEWQKTHSAACRSASGGFVVQNVSGWARSSDRWFLSIQPHACRLV